MVIWTKSHSVAHFLHFINIFKHLESLLSSLAQKLQLKQSQKAQSCLPCSGLRQSLSGGTAVRSNAYSPIWSRYRVVLCAQKRAASGTSKIDIKQSLCFSGQRCKLWELSTRYTCKQQDRYKISESHSTCQGRDFCEEH